MCYYKIMSENLSVSANYDPSTEDNPTLRPTNTDLAITHAIQQADQRAVNRDKPPATLAQINHMADGRIIAGNYPGEGEQSRIEASEAKSGLIDKNTVSKAVFQAMVDRKNLNPAYTTEIKLVYDYFHSKDIQIDPIRIVSEEVIQEAYVITGNDPDLAGEHPGEETAMGKHCDDRAIVKENKELSEEYGSSYILNLALHEAAHSAFTNDRRLRVVTETPGNRKKVENFIVSRLLKIDTRREANGAHIGAFWDEAFADLTRVRALREMGLSNDLTEEVYFDGVKIKLHPNSEDKLQPLCDSEIINMPAEFALFASPTSEAKNNVGLATANYAAFALELLDSRAPGLYDDFVGAIHDPKRQADAIRKIEGIKPGLYRTLSELNYTVDQKDFILGLRMVIGALEASSDRAK